jgi:carbohydrate-selective porin OprB
MSARKPPLPAAVVLCSALLLSQTASANDACCADKPDAAFAALTGDWGGVRSALKQNGIEVLGDYAAEVFGNPTGGKKSGLVFNALLKLALDVNLEKTVGWHDATFRLSGLYPHGTSGSLRDVGDASVYSSLDGYDSLRLIDFWVEQHLFEGKAALKVGQMLVDAEFGAVGIAGEICEEVSEDAVDEPWGDLGVVGDLTEGDFEFVEDVVAGFVDAGVLTGGADEETAEEIGQGGVAEPEAEERAEEVGAAEERGVRR